MEKQKLIFITDHRKFMNFSEIYFADVFAAKQDASVFAAANARVNI